jgi:hypothetical protein
MDHPRLPPDPLPHRHRPLQTPPRTRRPSHPLGKKRPTRTNHHLRTRPGAREHEQSPRTRLDLILLSLCPPCPLW